MSAQTEIDTVLTALKAAAEPTRLRLLILLHRMELTVTELTQILGQSQPRVSRHLKLLSDAGLVERFSEATWAFYRLADAPPGAEIATRLIDLIDAADTVVERDAQQLESIRTARADRAREYFRENAENWDQIRSLYVPEADVEAALLEQFADFEIRTLLDVGTGTGRMLELFAPRIERGIGIDLSREMLGLARANLDKEGLQHLQVRQGDMYHLDIEDGVIDAVVFHQVLHFTDDAQSAMAEAARVLRPGGRIAVVDFLPHALEFLREEHKHRRLGFSDREVAGWFGALGLSPAEPVHLEGRELTVGLWLASKEEA